MCGIIGFLDKNGTHANHLGKILLDMLQALSCRGPDSAGVALFAPPSPWHLRLAVPPGVDALTRLPGLGLTVHHDYGNTVYDLQIPAEPNVAALENRLQKALPGCEVICLGRRLQLFKQVGSPAELEATYHIRKLTGTHGIGHTRLSTESRVDLSHSQPFWAHGLADVATVHNGHITNYHKLRRQYEQQGYRFYTENDSEIIGIYLRDRMNRGLSFPDALRSSLDDFDGSFSYLAATADCLAYVKDRYAFKPLCVAETDDFVALATEEIALRQALGRDFTAREPAPGTLAIWHVPSLKPIKTSV
jgi:glutamate synthase domain-containing protein 1